MVLVISALWLRFRVKVSLGFLGLGLRIEIRINFRHRFRVHFSVWIRWRSMRVRVLLHSEGVWLACQGVCGSMCVGFTWLFILASRLVCACISVCVYICTRDCLSVRSKSQITTIGLHPFNLSLSSWIYALSMFSTANINQGSTWCLSKVVEFSL